MGKIIYLYILSFFLLANCTGTPHKDDRVLDYGALTELDIEIIVDIEESEHYLPGRLHDLVVTDDGSLIVSDWGSRSMVQFRHDGGFKKILAEQGQGPGEIKNFFSLIDAKRDTLVVKFFGVPRQLDFYIQEKNGAGFTYNYSLIVDADNNRIIDPIVTAPGYGYFAKFRSLNQNSGRELFRPPLYQSETIGVINNTAEIIIDTVHVLQSPSTIYIEASGGAVTPIGTPPYLNPDQIKYMADGFYLIAKPEDGLIQVFDQLHNIHNEIILEVKERPVMETDLEFHLERIPEQFRAELINRAPDLKPAFTDVWGTHDYFLLQADLGEKGNKMVLLDKSGEAIGKFYLSRYDEVQHFADQRIYTLHKDQESGHSIRVYEVNM